MVVKQNIYIIDENSPKVYIFVLSNDKFCYSLVEKECFIMYNIKMQFKRPL